MLAEALPLGSLALISLAVLGNWLMDRIKSRQGEEGGTAMEDRAELLQVVVSSLVERFLLPVAERTGA
ncbi:hypothetical protein GCM10010182_61140 [Actinomadura cremea]|nr:hypothetical protein GCM10010182_61140 [Actinomadura cremea]